jgi:hypothetical protein
MTVYAITLNCYKITTIKQFVLEVNPIPSQLYHHKKQHQAEKQQPSGSLDKCNDHHFPEELEYCDSDYQISTLHK